MLCPPIAKKSASNPKLAEGLESTSLHIFTKVFSVVVFGAMYIKSIPVPSGIGKDFLSTFPLLVSGIESNFT